MKKNKLYACLLTMSLCFSLCACGSSAAETKSKQESQISTENVQEMTPEVSTIDFTLNNRNIKFVGIEKANDELVEEENVYLIKFDFTNNEPKPEMCQQTFWIEFSKTEQK